MAHSQTNSDIGIGHRILLVWYYESLILVTVIAVNVNVNVDLYTVNHKKTWHFIFDYNFGKS